jgi:hypothetical protein
MASQAVTLLALFSLGLAPERPPRNPPTPNGPQPEFATVQAIDPVQKRIECLQSEVVIVPITVAVFENGRQVTKTAYRQEYRMSKRVFTLEKDAIYDTTGKKVAAEEALKRLKVGATVLVATQPVDPLYLRPVDPLYLRVIRPDALILVSPAVPAPIPIPPAFGKDKRGEPPPKR